MTLMDCVKVLLGALVLDAVLGEPPAKIHPVIWMGRVLDWLEARAPRDESARLVYGAGVACAVPFAWGCLGWLIDRFAPWPLQALAFKPMFAGRVLLDAARGVETALRTGELDDAQIGLTWLVSRPTTDLEAGRIASAAIESLGENLVDSWMSPLLAYACSGLGGAYVYRAANTADAMWGYHTPTYEYLGKCVARFDDVLNWLPARAAALLLVLAGPRLRQSFSVWRRDAGRTASPNAGHPMAALAGQLDVRLEKRDAYVLNADAAEPSVRDLAEAGQLVAQAMLLAAAIALVAATVRAHA